MSIYKNAYAIAEINFSLPSTHTHATDPVRDLILRVGNININVLLKNAFFRKTDATGTAVTLQTDVFELPSLTSDGTPFEGFLSADKDRKKGFYDLAEVDILENATLNDTITDELNIFRSGGVATKGVVTYTSDLDFNYALKPNTDYLIRSEVTDGLTNTSESILYGEVTVIKTNL